MRGRGGLGAPTAADLQALPSSFLPFTPLQMFRDGRQGQGCAFVTPAFPWSPPSLPSHMFILPSRCSFSSGSSRQGKHTPLGSWRRVSDPGLTTPLLKCPSLSFPHSLFALLHLVLKINMTQRNRKEMDICSVPARPSTMQTVLSAPFSPHYLMFLELPFHRFLSSQRFADFSHIASEWQRRTQIEFSSKVEFFFIRRFPCLGYQLELFFSQTLAPEQLLPESLPLRILLFEFLFPVQRALLCFHLDYFRNEMQQTFIEWCLEMNAWSQEPWVLVLALPLTGCVALAKSLVFLVLSLPLSKMGKCLLTGRLLSRSPFLSSSRLSLEAQTPLLPMGSCQAGHNLHLCLAHHPPLVCAALILLLLGLSGLGLGGFLLTHKTGLRSPDIPQVSTHPPAHPSPAGQLLLLISSHLSPPSFCTQDWVSFLRSFGQLTLCPMNGTVKGKWRGSHVVGLLTTLNFGDDRDRNKTQTFQAQVQGSRMGLKGETKEDCGVGYQNIQRWALPLTSPSW